MNESRLSALDEDERRRKVAHLLVHLSPESGWQSAFSRWWGHATTSRRSWCSRALEEMSLQVEQLLLADQEAYFAGFMGRPEGPDSSEHRGLLKEAQEKTLIANRMAAQAEVDRAGQQGRRPRPATRNAVRAPRLLAKIKDRWM